MRTKSPNKGIPFLHNNWYHLHDSICTSNSEKENVK